MYELNVQNLHRSMRTFLLVSCHLAPPLFKEAAWWRGTTKTRCQVNHLQNFYTLDLRAARFKLWRSLKVCSCHFQCFHISGWLDFLKQTLRKRTKRRKEMKAPFFSDSVDMEKTRVWWSECGRLDRLQSRCQSAVTPLIRWLGGEDVCWLCRVGLRLVDLHCSRIEQLTNLLTDTTSGSEQLLPDCSALTLGCCCLEAIWRICSVRENSSWNKRQIAVGSGNARGQPTGLLILNRLPPQ